MKASAPNWSLTGFHSRLVRKPKPNCRIESIECDASARIIATTINSTNSAAANIAARKIASPVLPVGERLRRQCWTNLSLSLLLGEGWGEGLVTDHQTF